MIRAILILALAVFGAALAAIVAVAVAPGLFGSLVAQALDAAYWTFWISGCLLLGAAVMFAFFHWRGTETGQSPAVTVLVVSFAVTFAALEVLSYAVVRMPVGALEADTPEQSDAGGVTTLTKDMARLEPVNVICLSPERKQQVLARAGMRRLITLTMDDGQPMEIVGKDATRHWAAFSETPDGLACSALYGRGWTIGPPKADSN